MYYPIFRNILKIFILIVTILNIFKIVKYNIEYINQNV